MKALWRINDKNGNQLGILECPDFLDIIDVCQRAKNKFGEDSNWSSPEYLGEID